MRVAAKMFGTMRSKCLPICRFTATGRSWCGHGLILEAMREQVEERLRRREEELVGGSKLAPAASTSTSKDRRSWLELDDSFHFQ